MSLYHPSNVHLLIIQHLRGIRRHCLIFCNDIIARTELLPNIRHLKWPRESPTDAVSLTTPVLTEPVSSRHPVRTISDLIAAANYGVSSNWRH
jgi:hypothetical protein